MSLIGKSVLVDSNLSKTIHYAELISAVAVVISLVFVGLEIRHSNSLSEAEAVSRINDSYNDMNLMVVGNLELAELLARANSGEIEFTEGENVSLWFWSIAQFNLWEAAWTTYDRGIIDLAALRGYMDSACRDVTAIPTLTRAWERARAILAAGFVEYIEAHCDTLD